MMQPDESTPSYQNLSQGQLVNPTQPPLHPSQSQVQAQPQPQLHTQPQTPALPSTTNTQPPPSTEKLLPFSLYDLILDIPYPGASSPGQTNLIYPPNKSNGFDVPTGVVDLLPIDGLTAEFGPEEGSGGNGAAKIARFAFAEYEDGANAQELAQRQKIEGSVNLNRHDAKLEDVYAPASTNNLISGTPSPSSGAGFSNGVSNTPNSPNKLPSTSLPSYHVFSHRLANGTTIHGHVRRYLPNHADAGGRRDVGRRPVRALVLLTRHCGGGNRLYSALLKSLEVLKIQNEALRRNVNSNSGDGSSSDNDSSQCISHLRQFMYNAFREHVNLCREVSSAMEGNSGAKNLSRPRILTLPLVEVGRGHGLFGSVDMIKLAIPPPFLHEREPVDASSTFSVAGLSRNDMLPMLRCLGVVRTMRLLSALASERRVIMTCGNVSKLSAVIYGSLAMMGQGLLPPPPVFVPVLPPGLVSLLNTPSAYLIGVITGPTAHFINLRNIPGIGEVVIFDLDSNGSEPIFLNIANAQSVIPDLTRRNMDDFDSATTSRASLPDMLYQDLSEVMKLDKRMMFWQGAVQEKLGMVADKGKTLAKATMKKGLKYLKGKSSKKGLDRENSGEVVEEENAEEEVAESESVLSKFVGKGNYSYENGYPNEPAELQARIAFSTFFVSLLGELRSYLTQQTPGQPPVIDIDKFMKYRAKCGDVPGTAMYVLISNLGRSKLFQNFVEARRLEVQMRRVVPEDAPLFAIASNFHRSKNFDFSVNNVRVSVRQLAENLPGKYLIDWNDNVRRYAMELTSTQAFNGDPAKALAQLIQDCSESSTILIDTMMILWTRIQEGKGLQWKKALFALQIFRDLLLNGPINAVAEAIDGFASIRILKSYNEALRGQNSALIRGVAAEIFSLVVDSPVLFARRRECMNRKRSLKDPKPSPLRKETRMEKGINQFRNVHIALCPAGASVAPAPPSADDLLGQEVLLSDNSGNSPTESQQPDNYSNDLLAMSFNVSPAPHAKDTPNTADTAQEQKMPNPFDMAEISQVVPTPENTMTTKEPSSTISSSGATDSVDPLSVQQNQKMAIATPTNAQFPTPTIVPLTVTNPSTTNGMSTQPKQTPPLSSLPQNQFPTPIPQGGSFPLSQHSNAMATSQPQPQQTWGQNPNLQLTPNMGNLQSGAQTHPSMISPQHNSFFGLGNPGPAPTSTQMMQPPPQFQQGMHPQSAAGTQPFFQPPQSGNAQKGGGTQPPRQASISQFDPLAK